MTEWCTQHDRTVAEITPGFVHGITLRRLWSKPAVGKLNCYLHSSWINDTSFCGGAWLLCNHIGDVLYHARDSFLPRTNHIAAELSCILWCLSSLHDLRIDSCEVWLDCRAALEAVSFPSVWPKYRSLTSKIWQVIRVMRFYLSSPKANSLAREIACSVTRDGRFNSYLALGGPAWLHDRIERDKRDKRGSR
ncbi:hypothetical protein CARUB_v10016034mg [Capsella rubella]|uniref:RNase H type-1 domain-containing protein n=1 Tax=Capsella rubella TaxID=81985 RepID=R0I418_9BRAS|nr:hypothetical protein CARUB_v10016034mg [Capsella rubella]